MINKLISNLPYNPSLVEELAFYGKRLRKEQSVRRIGVILIFLSLLVQLFAAAIPPEKSLAESSNDVIKGGPVKNLEDLKKRYTNNKKSPGAEGLYKRFGLTGSDMTHAKANLVNFNYQNEGARGVKTVGRDLSAGADHKLAGKFGGQTFYARSASTWSGNDAAIHFGEQKGTDGRYFEVWVIKDCGNIAFRPIEKKDSKITEKKVKTVKPAPSVGFTTPAPPADTPESEPEPQPEPEPEIPPNIKIHKSAKNLTQDLERAQTKKAKAGDIIEYTLTTKSTNNRSLEGYLVEDYIKDLLDYSSLDMNSVSSQGGTYSADSHKISWPNQSIPAEGELTKTFKITLKDTVPSTNQPNTTAPDFDCKMQNTYGSEVVIKVDCSVLKTVETLPNTGPGEAIAIAFGLTTLSSYFFARNKLISKELFILRKNYATSGGK